MKTYEEINEIAKMEEVGMRRNAGDQINTAFVHGFRKGEKLGYEEGYQQGLEDGQRQGIAIDGDKRYWAGYHAAQEDGQKIYQKGLDDAWACVRRLSESRTHKEWEELYAFFGVRPFQPQDIFKMYTASEAIEKIRAYEEKQKDNAEIKVGTKVRTTKDHDVFNTRVFPTGTVGTVSAILLRSKYPYKVCANGDYWWYSADMFEVIEEDGEQEEPQDDEIKIGDEVIYDGRTGVVDREPYHLGVDRELFVSIWFGGGMASAALANVKKTGRHFDGIEDALKQMSRFNPPSAVDGKPCTMCPAEGRSE